MDYRIINSDEKPRDPACWPARFNAQPYLLLPLFLTSDFCMPDFGILQYGQENGRFEQTSKRLQIDFEAG
jgi:hypothetical protein